MERDRIKKIFMTDISTSEYWSKHYQEQNTPWDIGYASPAIVDYFTNRTISKDSKILIPGAGNAHEAVWLWNNGYKHVWVADIAREPLENLKQKLPNFPQDQLLHQNFFDLKLQFDIIVEQTFFCALPPQMRAEYVGKMNELLADKGILVGVMFNFPLTEQGPPFGGSQEEYEGLFLNQFNIGIMEPCRNSIGPRMGNEFFVELTAN